MNAQSEKALASNADGNVKIVKKHETPTRVVARRRGSVVAFVGGRVATS